MSRKEFSVQDFARARFHNQIGESGITGATLDDEDRYYVIHNLVLSANGTITVINGQGEEFSFDLEAGTHTLEYPISGRKITLPTQVTSYHGYHLAAPEAPASEI